MSDYVINPFWDGGSDPSILNRVLMVHADTSAFLDFHGHTVTINGSPTNPAGDTGFGNCADFVTSNLVYADASSDFDMGTGDFTFKCRVRPTRVASNNECILDMGVGAGTPSGPVLYWTTGTLGAMKLWFNGADRLTTAALPNNVWTEVALFRESGVACVCFDGVSKGTVAMTQNFTTTQIKFADFNTGTLQFVGRLDEMRLIKGVSEHAPAIAGSNVYTPTGVPWPDS